MLAACGHNEPTVLIWVTDQSSMRRVDPWYDYLALPIAPLVIVVQCVALALRDSALKRVISIGGAAPSQPCSSWPSWPG